MPDCGTHDAVDRARKAILRSRSGVRSPLADLGTPKCAFGPVDRLNHIQHGDAIGGPRQPIPAARTLGGFKNSGAAQCLEMFREVCGRDTVELSEPSRRQRTVRRQYAEQRGHMDSPLDPIGELPSPDNRCPYFLVKPRARLKPNGEGQPP